MKKNILLALILIAAMIGFPCLVINSHNGFTKFEFVVEIEKCNGRVDTLTFTTKGDEEIIATTGEAVPVLTIGHKKILNVCDYKILQKQ